MYKGNAIIIHGGGLVDPSKFILMRLALNLVKVYKEVFIGKYSFESLYKPEFWLKYDQNLVNLVKNKTGCFFGTCRDIDLTDPILCKRAIQCLEERNITTIIVAGGDGSSRQVAEISDMFMANGINIIFAVPLTIDGINGGIGIGINEAAKESICQIEKIVSTSLETRDNEKFGVVVVELQGRNRDDIMAKVLRYFDIEGKVADCPLSDLTLRVIPANITADEEKLFDEIEKSSKRTLVLVSEGAKKKNPNFSVSKITERFEGKRKVRSLVVGHPSQSNGMTSDADLRGYYNWIDDLCKFIIAEEPSMSYSIANIDENLYKKPIDYYAELNPREGQVAQLSEELTNLLKAYMAGK